MVCLLSHCQSWAEGKHGSPKLFCSLVYSFSLAPVLLTPASTETGSSHGHGCARVVGVALCSSTEPSTALCHENLLFLCGWQWVNWWHWG